MKKNVETGKIKNSSQQDKPNKDKEEGEDSQLELEMEYSRANSTESAQEEVGEENTGGSEELSTDIMQIKPDSCRRKTTEILKITSQWGKKSAREKEATRCLDRGQNEQYNTEKEKNYRNTIRKLMYM